MVCQLRFDELRGAGTPPLAHEARATGRGRAAHPSGTRVLIDVRPLQDPERAPVTAAYLRPAARGLRGEPLAGESFVAAARPRRDDPTDRLRRPPARRPTPAPADAPLPLGRAHARPVLRARGADSARAAAPPRSGAAGRGRARGGRGAPDRPRPAGRRDPPGPRVVGAAGAVPARAGCAVRPAAARRSSCATRRCVIVAGDAVAAAAVRLLPAASCPGPDRAACRRRRAPPAGAGRHAGGRRRARTPRHRARAASVCRSATSSTRAATTRARTSARCSPRSGASAAAGRPARLAKAVAWPPRVLVLGASPDDRASLARQAFEAGVGDALAFAPGLSPDERRCCAPGPARRSTRSWPMRPRCRSSTRSRRGRRSSAPRSAPCPRSWARPGSLVPPRDPDRLAAALRAAWADERVHRAIADAAAARAAPGPPHVGGRGPGDARGLRGRRPCAPPSLVPASRARARCRPGPRRRRCPPRSGTGVPGGTTWMKVWPRGQDDRLPGGVP